MVFTSQQWFSLPLALRQRWWAESDYGAHAPSAALLMEILVVLSRTDVGKRAMGG